MNTFFEESELNLNDIDRALLLIKAMDEIKILTSLTCLSIEDRLKIIQQIIEQSFNQSNINITINL